MNTTTPAAATKFVTVKIGRSGKEVHAKECETTEGARGFFSNSPFCGQRTSSRSGAFMLRDNVTREKLRDLVTCAKCRAALGFE